MPWDVKIYENNNVRNVRHISIELTTLDMLGSGINALGQTQEWKMIILYCYELKILTKIRFLYILLQLNPSYSSGKRWYYYCWRLWVGDQAGGLNAFSKRAWLSYNSLCLEFLNVQQWFNAINDHHSSVSETQHATNITSTLSPFFLSIFGTKNSMECHRQM